MNTFRFSPLVHNEQSPPFLAYLKVAFLSRLSGDLDGDSLNQNVGDTYAYSRI